MFKWKASTARKQINNKFWIFHQLHKLHKVPVIQYLVRKCSNGKLVPIGRFEMVNLNFKTGYGSIGIGCAASACCKQIYHECWHSTGGLWCNVHFSDHLLLATYLVFGKSEKLSKWNLRKGHWMKYIESIRHTMHMIKWEEWEINNHLNSQKCSTKVQSARHSEWLLNEYNWK